MPSYIELVCNYCGKKYVGQTNQRHCSYHCARKANNPMKKNPNNFRNCKTCGKLFYYQPSGSRGIYCSIKCYREDIKISSKHCVICNKEYIPDRNNPIRWGKSKYCSLACLHKSQFTGKYINCKICNKSFWLSLYKLKRKENHFCSIKCYAIWKKTAVFGENNPNWKGGLVQLRKKQAGIGKGGSAYKKGKYYERKTRKMLEIDGYYTIRSGASKGIFDIIGIRESNIKLIQVKGGNSFLSPSERNSIKNFLVPNCVSKEAWIFCGNTLRILKFNGGNQTDELWIRSNRTGWKRIVV